MTQTWIVFKINNKVVDQMSSGAGEHKVKAFRTCLAYQHGVSEGEVHLGLQSQSIQRIQNQTVSLIVSSKLVSSLKVEMTRNIFKN